MSLLQVWGALLIFVLCPVLGGLPLTGWITRLVSGKKLAEIGTGNVGVSAAFYHGGRIAGILAVLSEAFKGIAAVLLARYFFPLEPAWEVIALIALVMGRYWIGKGAGTTNVVWGFVIHDWVTALLTFLISGIAFTIFRERKQGRLVSLILLPVITALRHVDEGDRVFLVACLSGLIAWIYQKLPDDLDLSTSEGRLESQSMFRFFRGDRGLLSLDQPLKPEKVGNKAATLAQLKAWGYPVPRGYVLPAGDDLNSLIEITQPSARNPVVVRSSALDEDTGTASAAGLYTSILNVDSKEALESAIQQCFLSYNNPGAVQYRKDRNLPEQGLAVLVQEQVQGVFSGVAFSRDPIARSGDAVAIEALPGAASQVVSGQQTPEQYRVLVGANDIGDLEGDAWKLPEALTLAVEGEGQAPSRLIQQVAYLARHLESRYHGIPQDIEWSFDGEILWLLQSRPITTLQPIWTRKIAAEVIPGSIRPLTWSINRPLTCGVWGEIFTVVLGSRAEGLDFEETATLHHSYAYFNATLLGDIFLRMGLPPESLEFLTRGAKFSKPPLSSTLKNVPGLLRLTGREMSLEKDFERDRKTLFDPKMQALASVARESLSPRQLLERIETVLSLLKRATYYSIFAPLSFAVREGLFKVPSSALDARQNPEVAALKELAAIATDIRRHLPASLLSEITNASDLMKILSDRPEAQPSRLRLEQFIAAYGYLSEVGTDIAVPTWQENPAPVEELLTQYVLSPPSNAPESSPGSGWKHKNVQRRLDLKGQVNALYSQLLAELRACFLALEERWLTEGWLTQSGDIFFLIYDEVQTLVNQPETLQPTLAQRIEARKQQFEVDRQLEPVPTLVFGNDPPRMDLSTFSRSALGVAQTLKGIGASPGIVEGTIRVMRRMGSLDEEDASLILVVPYTDSGWAPLLARANGLIAEVGGRLSHGAIVAREYGIPAIMDVTEATQRLHDGQRVRIDGAAGTVEVLEE
ncbi:MAG TPA: glycerol-3-phosphate acyltransferase [Leptolyngbyaceae cyanobacterium]